MGGRVVTVAAALILGVAGLTLAMLPQLQFAHHGMSLQVALETAASLIALLAAFLVFGRLRRHGGVNDLLLACGLAVVVLLNFCLLTMSALAYSPSSDMLIWVVLIGRSLGACLFAFAAFAPPRHRLRRPELALAVSIASGCVVLLLTAVIADGVAGSLTDRLAAVPSSHPPGGPYLGGYPALLTLQLVNAALYGASAVGFFRRSRLFGDQFLGWLAVSGALAAFSHLNYSLYSYPYAHLVHIGDIFRLCFCSTLLIGSMQEIRSYWRALSDVAVLEERQRIACDLHDGLAQELAYLARNLDFGDTEPGGQTLDLLRASVQRAQLESRRLLGALAPPRGENVEVALAEAAAEVADRFQLGLQLDLVAGVHVSAAREDALVRIAREAVTNAARHSGTSQVDVKLECDGPLLRLRVRDQGRGFDPGLAGDGFGLVSMRRRALSVGGELRISSIPGQGSEVEAAL